MPSSRTLITSQTLASSAASVTFTSIPATYTDLVLRASTRISDTGRSFIKVTFNSDTATNYSDTVLQFNSFAGGVESIRDTSNNYLSRTYTDNATNTANTFASWEFYIPSYTVSQNKPVSTVFAREENAASTDVDYGVTAQLWRNTAAITSIQITNFSTTTFNTTSSFYLYGIKNS
jgi:hypothetical protein